MQLLEKRSAVTLRSSNSEQVDFYNGSVKIIMFLFPYCLLYLLLLKLLICLYLWIRQKQHYWSKRNVPSDPASLFYFGRGEHVVHYMQRIYRGFKNSGHCFVGLHFFFQPVALLVDLDLIRNIFTTAFESFADRGLYHNKHDDPLTGNIVRFSGEPWRRLRTKLTPTFTSAKIRYMCGTFCQVAERFSELISELVQPHGAVLEVRDLCARFTTDTIGLVAFGIECHSLRQPNTEFRLMGDRVLRSFNPLLEDFGIKFPWLAKILHIKIFSRKIIEFYTNIITKNVEYREQHKIRRNDFLDILIELKNTQVNREFALTLQEIIGQSFVFFIAGFETSSSTMSFCLYELSQNQDIQQRARKEVMQCLKRHNNQWSYECLKDMKYLEQVISETLRKYPVVLFLSRIVRKDYLLPHSKQVIENSVKVVIPVYALHRDPDIYPNPDQFDPERFNRAAVQARHPMSYLPFGAGPRICIAERFGRLQTMIGIATLLHNFRFSNSAETPKVLGLDFKSQRFYSVAGGIPLKVTQILF